MNSFERTMCAIKGEKCDQTPVIPLIIQHALHVSGVSHRSYSTDPQKMAEAQIYCYRKYRYDGLHISTDNQIISEVLGCHIVFPEDEPPQYVSRILCDGIAIDKLAEVDPFSSGRMPVILEATRIVRRELNETCFIKVNCDSGPFSVAAALRGEERFFMDLYDNEQLVFDLLERCTKEVIKYARAISTCGAHAITFGDSTAGLIGREFYEKFALPFEKETISAIKRTGLPVFMHICGNTNDIIDLMAQANPDVLEIDSDMNLKTAYEKTDRKICFEGNVKPVSLWQGQKEEVYQASLDCISHSNGKNLILSSGCEVPRFTPSENIFAMQEAACAGNDIVRVGSPRQERTLV